MYKRNNPPNPPHQKKQNKRKNKINKLQEQQQQQKQKQIQLGLFLKNEIKTFLSTIVLPPDVISTNIKFAFTTLF